MDPLHIHPHEATDRQLLLAIYTRQENIMAEINRLARGSRILS